MTPEHEARCRDLGMRLCETFLRWFREQTTDAKLRKEIKAQLDRIRRGEATPAELGDMWAIVAGGILDYVARGEQDVTRARFGLLPTERVQ
ncbi:MAG TPA: hypothetical protein VFB27_14805 [Opitutaceae bacterium]|nr:hypothetical protein [Opitutaceae bacterium]